MDNDAEWVDAVIARRVAAVEYAREARIDNDDGIYQAQIAILRRLTAGEARARTKNYSGYDGSWRSADWHIVPVKWWTDFQFSGGMRMQMDWTAGDFKYLGGRVLSTDFDLRPGEILAVQFEIAGLPCADQIRAEIARPGSISSTTRQSQLVTEITRKKPGPSPDNDWATAIAQVTKDCIIAKYYIPLKRGQKAAIQTMLLSAMSAMGKDFSDDTARNYAKSVIEQLPES